MALRNQEIGARLRELRGEKPQTTVAGELGVAERTYQNWEAGDTKPSYRNLQILADYFRVGEEYILTGERRGSMSDERTAPDASRGAAKRTRPSTCAWMRWRARSRRSSPR
jgi:transcriptional regulator with XRE-family HTH domain